MEVTGWSPEEDKLTGTSGVAVEVSFSAEVEKTTAEEAFSLTSDGVEIPGVFSWRDSDTLRYELFHDLDIGKNYTLKVSVKAEDIFGNSLKKDFVHEFTTRTTDSRLMILSQIPADYEIVDDLYQTVEFIFDKQMNTASVADNFTISPPVQGYFTWSTGADVFTYNPTSPYEWNEEYTVTFSPETTDADGWELGYEHIRHFEIGTDRTPPDVILVSDETETYDIIRDDPDDATLTLTRNWEIGRNIIIQFSKEMDRDSVEGALTIEPQCSWSAQWSANAQGERLLIEWDEPLIYKTSYSLRIADTAADIKENLLTDSLTYSFRTDGSASKPPELMRLVYVKQPMTNPLREDILYDKDDPSNNKVDYIFSNEDEVSDPSPLTVSFDFYFSIASNSYINRFSFMENFSVTAQNSALTFTPTNIIAKHNADTPPYGGPVLPVDIGYSVVRLTGEMTDSDTAVGMVEFKVYRDFEDTLGNKMEEDWHWQVFDRDAP